MDPWTLKVIGIPLITVINFVTGFIPFFFISRNMKVINRKSEPDSATTQIAILSPGMKRFLSLANFFSGGVFLSTCFIGLYPGVNSKFNKIVRKNPTMLNYPYAGLCIALGFFVVWLLEIVVHMCIHCHNHTSHDHDHDHHRDHENESSHQMSSITDNNNLKKHCNSVMMVPLKINPPEIEDRLLNNCDDEVAKHDREDASPDENEPHSHVPISGNVLGSVMLTFALGSHSLIEGLGFGVLDDLGTVINMLVTMVIHESICAISLGVNIASKKTPIKVAVILILIFSILIPLGTGLGLILNFGMHKSATGEIVTAVLQGVAAGTFIYVVFIEILPNEMSNRKDQILRIFVMSLGFAVIAVLKLTHVDGHGSGPINNQTLPLMLPRHVTSSSHLH